MPEDAPGPVPRVPEEAHSSDDLHMEVLKKTVEMEMSYFSITSSFGTLCTALCLPKYVQVQAFF